MEATDLKLSPPERPTLQHIAERILPERAGLGAVQRLKKFGLVEEPRPGGVALSSERRRASNRLLSKA
jgi:hypothetical protein